MLKLGLDWDDEVLKIYPNPSYGAFYIVLNADAQVQAYTLSGQCILNANANKGVFTIDLSGYANGFYFIKIKDSAGLKTVKLIKN